VERHTQPPNQTKPLPPPDPRVAVLSMIRRLKVIAHTLGSDALATQFGRALTEGQRHALTEATACTARARFVLEAFFDEEPVIVSGPPSANARLLDAGETVELDPSTVATLRALALLDEARK
jgi:hypothetical protein